MRRRPRVTTAPSRSWWSEVTQPLRYVTTNEGKLAEARAYLEEVDAEAYDYVEIQADDLEPIAAAGARTSHAALGGPVVVDDAGLFIPGLGGFPGPYTAYVDDTIGVEAVGQLARSTVEEPVEAIFRCVLAYCDGTDAPLSAPMHEPADADGPAVAVFAGEVTGEIVPPRGEGGFGYDPIFAVDGQTFAELTAAEKNQRSHRGRALAAFARWYAAQDASGPG
jgi:dITPase (EC 3.6.1.-)